MPKHGKKYKEVAQLVDRTKKYSVEEAMELVKKLSYSKFPGSVEVHIKTGADPRYQDQQIRGTVVLPHGTGKVVRVAAFVSDDKIEEAKKAGADIAGNQDLLAKIEKGEIDFDVLVTTPDMIRELAKVAKILWPKWLMPSPKAGTVTPNIAATIQEIKKGRVEFKLDKTGNIHVSIGKVDFDTNKLVENFNALLQAIEDARPSGVKGKLIRKVVVAPTMWPGVPVEVQTLK